MSKSKFNPLITATVMSAVYLAGVSNVSNAVVLDGAESSRTLSLAANAGNANASLLPALNAEGHRRYIIQLHGAAVARYDGVGELAAIPRRADNKIEVNSPAVQSYVSYLEQQQQNFIQSVSSTLNRNVVQRFSYQYALNGVVLELTAEEASTLGNLPEVKSVSADMAYELDTDAGPQLIGADNVWTGTAPATGTGFGEGVVIGILDTGANFDHPSFAAVGGDAYAHTNPLGAGNYLGVCDPSNTEQYIADYTCNDKIIGGYDFINDITPPSGFDIPGPEDENGHGTHTASTAGGNVVLDAEINGITNIAVSGVAPHANIIPFDVCYNPDPAEGGGCFGSATVASIDQILADGVVDVVNYSISGGTNPWGGFVEQAFLSATDSGVFVSASAGNSGPGPGTLGHLEPWTASVGASTHNRRFSNDLTVTAPTPVPAELVGALAIQGTGPVMVADMVGTMEYAGNIDGGANVTACTAFTDPLTGLIAVISRGGCAFADKVNNAVAAGAVGVVVHNNVPGDPIIMGGLDTTTVPAVMVSLDIGLALDAFIDANPGVAEVSVAGQTSTNLNGQADSMAAFSSRGPSPFEYNKPDVTGPGVSILAGFADSDTGTGTLPEYGVISGTSMSSPHNAGAAALLKEIQPSWTVPEIKSALMMTAKTAGVTKEDGLTPADPFDRGAGRIQVDVASSAGLVLNETAFRFLLADPANGGDPKTLNVASYKNNSCVGTCSFQRKFTSVAATPINYTASLVGMTGTVNPATFTANPGQTVTLNVEIDGAALPAGATSFGELMITEQATVVSNTVPFTSVPADPNIPDDNYDGSLGSMLCETINVTGINADVFSASLDMSMSHTWTGDVTIKLQNPNGDVLGVMSRPGLAEPADDGSDCCGSSEALVVSAPVSFFDGAATSAEDMGSFGDDICAVDGICEYAPFPDSVANPPATFADLGVGSANGDWNVCVGDSGNGDTGTLESVTLNVLEFATTVPNLHLPLVVVGFPEQPDIDVNPLSLAATLDADMTTDLNLNISNSPVAGADLNWMFGTGSFSLVYAEQVDATGTITNGIVSGFFLQDNGGAGSGAYSADDFVLSQDSSIETMYFEGFANSATLSTSATSIQLQVFADNAGVPDGHPEDGLNSALFALDIPVADPSLDLTDNNISIDVSAANGGMPLDLPAGTYWVSVFPTQNMTAGDGTRWNWYASGPDVAGAAAQLISPISFGVADWTGIPGLTAEPNFEQLAYNIAGSSVCGAPWITTSVANGVIAPGLDTDVTVTLDSTGMTPGVYTATLCVDSDDPDEAQVLVPVTMTVDGPSDLIFKDGFEGTP